MSSTKTDLTVIRVPYYYKRNLAKIKREIKIQDTIAEKISKKATKAAKRGNDIKLIKSN